jgi:hypothetical protein
LIEEAVYSDGAILASTNQPAITQTDTGNWSGMAREGALVLASSRIPYLDGFILGPRNEPKCIGSKAPHALYMAEEAMNAPTRRYMP